MSDNHILVECYGLVQIIRLNRPEKKNAITRAMYQAMTDALKNGECEDAIHAHVILGSEGAFSAGNDMQDFMAFAMGGAMGTEVFDFLMCLSTLKKPIVSGVDGLAIGIGTTIHLHCDMTFATPLSTFKTPFVDLALVPEAGSSLLGPAMMGHQRAYAMFAAGEGFSADEAREAGLIWKVVDQAELEVSVMTCARSLAAKPPIALALAKQLLRPEIAAVQTRIEEEGELFKQQLLSDEAKQAFMAFMARKAS
ncbi:MAG: crotonase/enoyl-CoA hydratase family protein [Pseudomonadota bacterium]